MRTPTILQTRCGSAVSYGVGWLKNHPFVDGEQAQGCGLVPDLNGLRLQATQTDATLTMRRRTERHHRRGVCAWLREHRSLLNEILTLFGAHRPSTWRYI